MHGNTKMTELTISEATQQPSSIRWAITLPVLAVLLALPLVVRNEFYLDLLVMIFFWATLAGAWNLLGGFAGQISIGHTAYFGIGAYTSTLLFLNYSLSPWLGLLAGGALSILVAAIVGYPCFRLSSHFFALATIAFAEVLRLVASYWRGLTKGGLGLLIPFKPGLASFMFQEKMAYAYVALGFMLAILLVSWAVKRSRFGFSLVSLREDQDGAESLGVNTHRCKMLTLIISAFFTSAMGTFYAQYFQFIDPEISFSLSLSIQLPLLSIIGGLGTVMGPVVGAFLLTPIDVLLRGWLGGVSAGLNLIVYGAILDGVGNVISPSGWLVGSKRKRTGGPSKRQWSRGAPGPRPSDVAPSGVSLPDTSRPSSGQVLFQARSLGKRFGGLQAVRDLTFHINRGEIVGLIGPNGAGKTTVFNLISGFIPPDTGEVEFKGEENHRPRASPSGMPKRCGKDLPDRQAVPGHARVGET